MSPSEPRNRSVMRTQPIDFVQISYNLLDRQVEERLLPLAQERGIAVLVEKPLAATPQEADLILARASAAGAAPVQAGHIERFNPAVLELGRLLEAGWLSSVFAISSRRAGPFPARIRGAGAEARGGSQRIVITVTAEDGSGLQMQEKAAFLSPRRDGN